MTIETYRGHSIHVGPDPDDPSRWAAAVLQGSYAAAFINCQTTEVAALAEAKRRIDLLLEKPR